jgi:hypothetical protein
VRSIIFAPLMLAYGVACAADWNNSGSIVSSSIQPAKYYVYDPRPDITAPELAEVFKILLPALACRNVLGNGCDPTQAIESAPENVKRHFLPNQEQPK